MELAREYFSPFYIKKLSLKKFKLLSQGIPEAWATSPNSKSAWSFNYVLYLFLKGKMTVRFTKLNIFTSCI